MRKNRFRGHRKGRIRTSGITWNTVNSHSVTTPSQYHQHSLEQIIQTEDIIKLKDHAKLIEKKLEEINDRIKDYKNIKTKTKFIACIDQEKCTGCTRCVICCPHNAISINNNIAYINQAKCRGCGLCVAECKRNAITLKTLSNKKNNMVNI